MACPLFAFRCTRKGKRRVKKSKPGEKKRKLENKARFGELQPYFHHISETTSADPPTADAVNLYLVSWYHTVSVLRPHSAITAHRNAYSISHTQCIPGTNLRTYINTNSKCTQMTLVGGRRAAGCHVFFPPTTLQL